MSKTETTKADKVQSLGGAIIVKYHGPTNSRGSRWTATIDRGGDYKFKATAAYDYSGNGNDGADYAALSALSKFTAWVNNGTGLAATYSNEIKGRVLIGDSVYAYVFE